MFLWSDPSEFFGHNITDNGTQPDPNNVAPIQEMEPPKNREDFETLLGMVNYLAKSTPNLAETTAPMGNL